MPGNEKELNKFLIANKGYVDLSHLGLVRSISTPIGDDLVELHDVIDVDKNESSASNKKADIYINDVGVSVKQKGGSFSFNRLQRAQLKGLLGFLGMRDIPGIIDSLDIDVSEYHAGSGVRNREWQKFFEYDEFRKLVHHFLMVGYASKNSYSSKFPAELLLEAPKKDISTSNIEVYTFSEYFDKYIDKFKIAIRRQWIGQKSKSEHERAVGLARKPNNWPWVYHNVVGQPGTGWRHESEWPLADRKTVYFLMIEKE